MMQSHCSAALRLLQQASNTGPSADVSYVHTAPHHRNTNY